MSNPKYAALAILGLTLTGSALLAQRALPRPERPDPPSRPVAPPMPTPSRPLPPGPADGSRATRNGTVPQTPPVPAGFSRVDRPIGLPHRITDQIVLPRATPRCPPYPAEAYWRSRDISREIQFMARQGFIPVTAAGDATEITGEAWYPAGWRAYAFVVPGKEKLHVRLHHPNEGWFRLAMVNRWGQVRPGMLQNLIPTGNPEVTFNNLDTTATTVYVIVDDPGWMSTEKNPFTLNVDRSWDPAKNRTPDLPPVMGIWAEVKLVPTRPGADAAPAPKDAPKEAPAS